LQASFAGQRNHTSTSGAGSSADACLVYGVLLQIGRLSSSAQGFDHSVWRYGGVQRMVRSDLGGAGVMFSPTLRPAFMVILINAAWVSAKML
jgi:pyruvate,water dikinase